MFYQKQKPNIVEMVYKTAPGIYFAFRGRLVSLRSAYALRSLTDAFPPPGVYVYSLHCSHTLFVFCEHFFDMSQPLSRNWPNAILALSLISEMCPILEQVIFLQLEFCNNNNETNKAGLNT